MTVDELRHRVIGVDGDTPLVVALLERCGDTIEAMPGRVAGVTYDLDDDGAVRAVWVTATATRVAPVAGDYRCGCGATVRFGHDDESGRLHVDCE